MKSINKPSKPNGLVRYIFIAQLFIFIVAVANGQYNQQLQSQRFGQQQQVVQNNFQYQQLQNQQYPYLRRDFQGVNSKAASYKETKFTNSPVSHLNGTAGALVQIQLLQYSNPDFALPDGNTCACPREFKCLYLQEGAVTCSFSFTIIISASNQSVQYIASPFVPAQSSPITTGVWTNNNVFNMTVKPMTIDIFVHHLGVVINRATGILEYISRLTLVDTFVFSLDNYQPTPYGALPNTVRETITGQVLGTTLQLAYSVQCIGGKQGPNCDLTCIPAQSKNQYAACISAITGMYVSCSYNGNTVTRCSPCPYGLTENQTACFTPSAAPVVPHGISSAFRVWTIVLGCLLSIAMLFIILLVVLFITVRNHDTKTSSAPFMGNTYAARPDRPLLYQNDDEWRRSKTRATTGGSGVSSHTPTSEEPTEGEYIRSNGASIARREAHV